MVLMWHRASCWSSVASGATILVLLFSALDVGAEECGGFGHLHGSACHCDDGYSPAAGDPSVCLSDAAPAIISGSWTAVLAEADETPEQHIWHVLGKEENEAIGVEEMQKMIDALSGVSMLKISYGEDDHHEADDPGDGDGQDKAASPNTAPGSSPTRRLLQEVCGGVGHPHNGVCHCDDGYLTDPQDPSNCVAEAPESSAAWHLAAADVLAYAGENGAMQMEDMATALPLIASCLLDPSCSLSASDEAREPTAVDEPEGEVELWMALVAAVCFFIVPLLGMGIPVLAARLISTNKVNTLTSLGNCLSAGIMFSLGIMHIIPASVESMFSVGVAYPLNYLLIVVGFFTTFFLEDAVPDHGALGMTEPEPASHPAQPSHELQKPSPQSDDNEVKTLKKITVQEQEDTCSVSDPCRPEEPQQQRGFVAALLWLLPLLVFFVAIQFHACVEAVLVGIQTDPENFWILFAGVAIHKLFVSFALGVKLQEQLMTNRTSKWHISAMAALWALLPSLCVIIGYLSAATIEPMAALVLTSLSAGIFIYVGSYELLGEEFKEAEAPELEQASTWGSKKRHTYLKYMFVALGGLLVALLSAIPHKHD